MIRFACIAVLFFSSVAAAQQRPLLTEDVDIISPGTIRIEAGGVFMQGAKYSVSGIRGDLTRVGVIGINFGMGPNVEFQIEGVAQNYLSINSRGPSAIPLELLPGANSTNDTGDFTLAAKFKLRNETRRGPSLGFRFGVKLSKPNRARGPIPTSSRTAALSVTLLSFRRATPQHEPGPRHRNKPNERLRINTSGQEVWSRRPLQYFRQPRDGDSHRADGTVLAKRRNHLRAGRNLSYQQTVQRRRRGQRPRQHASR